MVIPGESGSGMSPEARPAAVGGTGRSSAPVHWLETIDSTNSELLRLAEAGAPDGTAAAARYQTAGRGKLQSRWHMPPGEGVLVSVLLREVPAATGFVGLTLEVGRRLAERLGRATGRRVDVRSPNDLLIDGRKVGGILCEARWRGDRLLYVVVGVGINVNVLEFPAEISARATSLRLAVGREFDVEALTRDVIDCVRDLG